MNTITKELLKEKIDTGENFSLVEVLGKDSYAKWHIPGAVNIPLDELERHAREAFPDKTKEIIVYCSSFECQASTKAAHLLGEMGYTNVFDYEGGKADWENAGYPSEE